jgi:hypothetical protein
MHTDHTVLICGSDHTYKDTEVNVVRLPPYYHLTDLFRRALCQTRVLTPAINAAVDPSVKQLTTNFTCYKINKCVYTTKYVSSYLINYQCFHRFVIILGVALQEYKECNNLPYRIFGTTEYYNKCPKHRVFQFTHFYNSLYSYYCCNATDCGDNTD